jgi:hypothetical protein
MTKTPTTKAKVVVVGDTTVLDMVPRGLASL